MVELRDITFENINRIIKLKPKFSQRKYVERASETIAMAYAGINEQCPGFASAIYSNGEPVGLILIGRGPVSEGEPEIIRQNKYVYRLMGFLIDKNHQHGGIGREALKLALEKVKEYPDGDTLPIMLEVHKNNQNALKLYESLGFYNTRTINGDDYVLVRLA